MHNLEWLLATNPRRVKPEHRRSGQQSVRSMTHLTATNHVPSGAGVTTSSSASCRVFSPRRGRGMRLEPPRTTACEVRPGGIRARPSWGSTSWNLGRGRGGQEGRFVRRRSTKQVSWRCAPQEGSSAHGSGPSPRALSCCSKKGPTQQAVGQASSTCPVQYQALWPYVP